jgi:hypothetical protein
MSAEYRFLRFEVVGIATVVFLVVGLLPVLDKAFLTSLISTADAALAVVAGLFLVSLPIGYAEHQIVVNVYRSPKMNRAPLRILKDIVTRAEESCKKEKKEAFFRLLDDLQKNSFLTALLDFCIYCRDSTADPGVFTRLSDRWSHFYARRAIGRYAPVFSVVLWIVTIALGYVLSWPIIFKVNNFAISIIWWVVIFVLCNRSMDVYANKIMLEISFLETSIVLANREKMEKKVTEIVCYLAEHPEYIDKGESYGAAIYRM